MVDKVADTLIRIKNSYRASKKEVLVNYSRLVVAILTLLKQEGYITNFSQQGRFLFVELKYTNKEPALTFVRSISKPSLRVYKGAKFLPNNRGLGITIVSTPAGVMTTKEARQKNLGGEVMAEVH
ncbi:MAG: 30S ribosomal protein S8 [Candidatus Daviesbacteria bacterium]|nr:MAG: 30S ribosomal protein S8 [Candidatus Daviesbacteria bacterium]